MYLSIYVSIYLSISYIPHIAWLPGVLIVVEPVPTILSLRLNLLISPHYSRSMVKLVKQSPLFSAYD